MSRARRDEKQEEHRSGPSKHAVARTRSFVRSRRAFLATVARSGAAALLRPSLSWADDTLDPRTAGIVAATIGIDAHNHVDVPMPPADVPGPDLDLARNMKESGLSAICMTFATDRQKLTQPDEGYMRFISALTTMDQLLTCHHMKRSLSLADLRAAHKKKQPTVIQAVEGGHFLNGHLERVEEAYKRGLRLLGLLHDSDASVPLGDIYTAPAHLGGLTAFGVDVIRECNRLGILVDLTHASAETVTAALKVSTRPVVFSHTGLDTRLGQNERAATMMRPRLISKEEAQTIAGTGGVIGAWTHLADTATEYAQNVRALVDTVGIDHVCIGTDTQIARNTNQAWRDMPGGFYYAVVDALLKAGFTPDEIGKIGGGNFCRVFDAATKGHA